MNSKINSLKQEVFQRIQRAAVGFNAAETVRLAPMLDRLSKMEKDMLQISVQLQEIERALANNKAPTSQLENPTEFIHDDFDRKGTQSKLRIRLKWSRIGKNLKDEEINERFASETMAKFLSRLILEMGAQTEGKIRHFVRAQGGQLYVSENPKTEPAFRNQQSGKPYAFSPIPGTKLFVLTNINTNAKHAALESLVQYLGLPAGFVSIEIVPRGTMSEHDEELLKSAMDL